MTHNPEPEGLQGYLEDANPVTGTGYGAWRKGVVTFHLGVGDVGPGDIQEVDTTPGGSTAEGGLLHPALEISALLGEKGMISHLCPPTHSPRHPPAWR